MRLGTTTLSVTQPGRRRRPAVSGGGGGGSGGSGGGSGSGFVTTDLVASYDAGDTNSYSGTGTTWSDLTSNSNDLTLTNGPGYSATDGGLIDFDGTNDYSVTSNTVSLSGDFTIDAWVNIDTAGTGYNGILSIGGYDSSTGFTVFGPYIDVWSGGSPEGTFSTTFSTNAWNHIALTRSGSTCTLYLNKTSVGTFTNSSTFSGEIIVGAGKWSTTISNYLNGKISNARFYNGTALTVTQITQNYNAGDPSTRTSGGGGSVVTTGLIAHVDAGDTNSYGGTGTTWTDLTSYSNDFTLTNGPVYSSSTDGGVFTFDGTDDRAETSNNVSLLGDFSFDAWINTGSNSGAQTVFAIGNYDLTSGLKIETGSTGGSNNRYYFMITTGNTLVYNGSLISSPEWAHVALVRSGSTVTVYLNKYSIATFTNSASLSGKLLLGASKISTSSNYVYHLGGKISNARLYKNTALSATEVAQNYDALSGRF